MNHIYDIILITAAIDIIIVSYIYIKRIDRPLDEFEKSEQPGGCASIAVINIIVLLSVIAFYAITHS